MVRASEDILVNVVGANRGTNGFFCLNVNSCIRSLNYGSSPRANAGGRTNTPYSADSIYVLVIIE